MNRPLTKLENNLWIVFAIGSQSPTVSHDTEDNAITEAKRLSLINPDKQFLVCRITTGIKTQSIKQTTIQNYLGG